MIRKLVFLFTIIIFLQAPAQDLDFDYCISNCNQNFDITAFASGAHTVKIINSNGRTMKMAYYNSYFSKNQSISFDVDMSLWKPGSYILVVELASGRMNTREITINPLSD